MPKVGCAHSSLMTGMRRFFSFHTVVLYIAHITYFHLFFFPINFLKQMKHMKTGHQGLVGKTSLLLLFPSQRGYWQKSPPSYQSPNRRVFAKASAFPAGSQGGFLNEAVCRVEPRGWPCAGVSVGGSEKCSSDAVREDGLLRWYADLYQHVCGF